MTGETLGGRERTLGKIGEASTVAQKAAKEADIFRCLPLPPEDNPVVFKTTGLRNRKAVMSCHQSVRLYPFFRLSFSFNLGTST